ncbi:MAG TPA: tetratricopeptide repeat protein [Tenuifilaceae bacterium]|nr:tetratricopeptide repeat protein [Tenuifilaceae bacterium]
MKVSLKIPVLALLLIFVEYGFAQPSGKMDSLITAFHKSKADTVRVEVITNMGFLFEGENPDSSLHFYIKAASYIDSCKGSMWIGKAVKQKLLLLKANVLLRQGAIFQTRGELAKATDYYNQSHSIFTELSKSSTARIKLLANQGLSDCLGRLGKMVRDKGDYALAISYFTQATQIDSLLSLSANPDIAKKGSIGIAKSHLNIGILYYDRGSFEQALHNYHSAAKIFDKLNDSRGLAVSYNAIGNILADQRRYQESIEQYQKVVKYLEPLGNKLLVSRCYNNIGVAYKNMKNDSLALEYYNKSMRIAEEFNDVEAMAALSNNIGNIYSERGRYAQATPLYQKAEKLYQQIEDKNALSLLYSDLSQNYRFIADSTNVDGLKRQQSLRLAVGYGEKALRMGEELQSLTLEQKAADMLMKAYASMGLKAKAFDYAKILIDRTDSLFSEQKTTALAEMESKYNWEKQQLEIENLNKAKEVQELRARHQRNLLIGTLVGIVLLVLLLLVIVGRLRIVRRQKRVIEHQNDKLYVQNEQLNQQKEEIEAQRDEIEAQRNMVVDQKRNIEKALNKVSESIDYASQIQGAILPETLLLDAELDSYFLLYKPKDIVSGDFYWWTKIQNRLIMVMADCTGHGVPGAFMSVLGASLLNEIVYNQQIVEPNSILEFLRKEVIRALRQEEGKYSQRDGMDMSVISIDCPSRRIYFAGANGNIAIASASGVSVVKGDRATIGISRKMAAFTQQELEIAPSDTVYLYTDGYSDQLGGNDLKKFSFRRFVDMLESHSSLPLAQQKAAFEQANMQWRAQQNQQVDQTDDITLLGLRLK